MEEDMDYEFDEWEDLPNLKLPKGVKDDEAMKLAIKDIEDDNKRKTPKARKSVK
jgi:hypothetical protein